MKSITAIAISSILILSPLSVFADDSSTSTSSSTSSSSSYSSSTSSSTQWQSQSQNQSDSGDDNDSDHKITICHVPPGNPSNPQTIQIDESAWQSHVDEHTGDYKGACNIVPPPATNTPPVITLLGDNPFHVATGTSFIDPGATATDTQDGDLTSHIITTGSVDASTTGTYIVTYSVTDSGGLSASTSRTVIITATSTNNGGGNGGATNTPPVITLLGSNPLNLFVGDTFTDPGATATDTQDGDLTSHIIITGSVDTSTTSTSTLIYTVTDSGGLSASTTRNVIVNATTTNGGGGNGGGGATNTPPTITLLGDNPLQVATDTQFIDPGATATDTQDGDLTSHIIITGSVDASTTGTYTLTYSVTDSGGLSTSTSRTVLINSTATSTNNGGGGNGGGGGGSGGGGGGSGGGGIGGRRHDISDLLSGGGQVLGASTALGECSYLRDYLHIGWNNDTVEILKLQSFLNIYEHENLALNGNFDQSTFDAVERFQTKYASDILTPWGYTGPTGYVYLLTKKKINEIYCDTTIALTPDQQQEIATFHDLWANALSQTGSYPGTGTTETSGGTSSQGGNSTSSILGNISNIATGVGSVISDGMQNVSKNGGLRNLAVSLFGAPQGLGKLSSTYLFLLLAAILAAVLWPAGPKKKSITVTQKAIPMPAASGKIKEVKKSEPVAPKKAEAVSENTPSVNPVTPENAPAESADKAAEKGFKGIIG